MNKKSVIAIFLLLSLSISVVSAYALMNDGYYARVVPINRLLTAAPYYSLAVNAASSWNNALPSSGSEYRAISVGSGPSIGNNLLTANRADSWTGYYQPLSQNSWSTNKTTSFTITVNTRLMDNESSDAQQSVIAHEYGHALGLNHVSGAVLMNPSRNKDVVYTPKADDINGAKKQATNIIP